MKDVKPGELRRKPSQRRGIEKIERLLDAAAALLDEQGPAALTTSALAARAGISVGTVYHYFEDVGAVLDALVARHLARAAALIESQAANAAQAQDAGQLIDALLDAYIEFFRQEPGLRAVWLSDDQPARQREASRKHDAELAEAIRHLLARTPNGGRMTRDEVLASLCLSDSLLGLAFRLDPRGDPSTLAALRHLVHELFRFYEGRRAPAPR